MKQKNVYIKEIKWPSFGDATPVLTPTARELNERIAGCRKAMKQSGLHIR